MGVTLEGITLDTLERITMTAPDEEIHTNALYNVGVTIFISSKIVIHPEVGASQHKHVHVHVSLCNQ